jgi:hypothetical protein
MFDPVLLEPLWSGQPDGLAILEGDSLAIVWDFKTGRAEVDPAESNWQLRSLAVLVAETFAVQSVIAAIIQPWVSPGITLAHYSRDEIATARTICLGIVKRAMQADQPRIPTAHGCHFCKAKAICPEATAIVPRMAALTLRDAPGEVVDGATIARLLPHCGPAERMAAAIKARAIAMLQANPDSVPGWRLEIGTPREKIEDTATVFTRWKEEHPADADRFLEACTATKTALKPLLKAVTGLKGKSLEAEFAALIEGCTKTGKAPVSLEPIQ